MIFESEGASFAAQALQLIENEKEPTIFIDETLEAKEFGNFHGIKIAALRETLKSLKEKISELQKKKFSLEKFLNFYEAQVVSVLKNNPETKFSGMKYGLRIQQNGGVQSIKLPAETETVSGLLTTNGVDESLFETVIVYKLKKEIAESMRKNGEVFEGLELEPRGFHLRII